ncbi:hypothetical protein KHS38_04155 [Mucilaginibacter sp. Bleaf8]|uniref:hypothetical protein n=1 Tax=Mucilaginibacter sp. Bleaf8 TaxID=2834430 RepID=UPI001BCE8F29|nr:hypothetical protein [Mucilaginibacter sp. Bleaf8]MBS7563591.1 hypothetical protein [Mucilaginibacter sp. Bleaf8]
MNPIYVAIGQQTFKILPDTQAHADGHAVITHTYHVFKDERDNDDITRQPNLDLNISNPDYFGYITFELPGRMFTYTSNGSYELSNEDIEQLIEQINHYRDHPELWRY